LSCSIRCLLAATRACAVDEQKREIRRRQTRALSMQPGPPIWVATWAWPCRSPVVVKGRGRTTLPSSRSVSHCCLALRLLWEMQGDMAARSGELGMCKIAAACHHSYPRPRRVVALAWRRIRRLDAEASCLCSCKVLETSRIFCRIFCLTDCCCHIGACWRPLRLMLSSTPLGRLPFQH
jgi:hypothetical protein